MANFYDPRAQVIDLKQVGTTYHLALGTTTPGQTSNDRIYGYMLAPDPKFGGLEQVTDLQARGRLTSYSSELLIDRDFVNYPRVTDGNFAGGGLQQVFLDTTRYWDSDLETRTPGYLMLRPQWRRVTTAAVVSGTPYRQVVAYNGDAYFAFGEANGNYYTSGTTYGVGPYAIRDVDTDGLYLYIGDGSSFKQVDAGNIATVVAAAVVPGTYDRMWVINQGTSGRFLYYSVLGAPAALYKIDLSLAFPVAVGLQAQVPLGSPSSVVIDVVPYLNGIAILAASMPVGPTPVGDFDVWQHDGAVLSRIVHVDGYVAKGMTSVLGSLYVGAEPVGQLEVPALFRIAGGSVDVAARAGIPIPSGTTQMCLGPRSSGEFVYLPLITPQVNGITANSYILVYNVVTGAISHLPAMNSGDWSGFTTARGPRQFAVIGRTVCIIGNSGASGYLTFQDAGSALTVGLTNKYQASGWMVSSRIDFNTPGISKMFRRVIVNHAPLGTGESIKVSGYVDQNPVSFTTGLTSTATVTNSTVGTTATTLTFPSNTRGLSMYFALQLTAGTGQLTSPVVYYVATEATTPWDFQFTVDCTNKRQTIGQQPDPQGLTGRDLYYLLKNAWENGQSVTLYHPTGETYICAIEQARFFSPSPQYGQSTPLRASDFESWATLTLRHINAN